MNSLPRFLTWPAVIFGCTWLFSFGATRSIAADAGSTYATPYYFGTPTFTSGDATSLTLDQPIDVAVAPDGSIYFTEFSRHVVRKVTPAGVLTTFAGTAGQSGSTNATGAAARFNLPHGITVDQAGNLYVVDHGNHLIRKITPAGVVTTLAGLAGIPGNTDGSGAAARFQFPAGIAVDGAGTLYVADSGNHRIRKLTPAGAVSTLAGSGTLGTANGTGPAAQFNFPNGIAVASNGTLFVADNGNHAIRAITAAGVVTTFLGQAGTSGTRDGTGNLARFESPSGIALDADGNLYISDSLNHTIRKSSPAGVVTTLAGVAGQSGITDGRGPQARFGQPIGIAVDPRGNVYVADVTLHRIRRSVQPPQILIPPPALTVAIGGAARITATIFSDFSPTHFQWAKNGTPIFAAGTMFQPVNGPLEIAFDPTDPSHAGVYSVTVSNPAGSVTSAGGTLTVVTPPVISTQPQSIAVTAGLPASFSVVVTPSAGVTYQWRKNGAPVAGATAATFSLAATTLADSGNYSVAVTANGLTLTSNPATLTVNVPVSTTPVTHTVTVGSPVTFNFTGATPGTTFQWRKNGTPIAGATAAILSIANATLSDAGDYTLVFTAGSTTTLSNAATLVVLPLPPPAITTQPASQTVIAGATVQFTVAATSPSTLSFQWRKNGVALAGATTDRLTLPGVSLNDSGIYSVIVSNSAGSITSNNTTLTVTVPVVAAPAITAQPVGQTVSPGGTLLLSVAVTGSPPFSVQWFRNGSALAGATTLQYAIEDMQPADAGSYLVTIGNSAGLATSNAAVVQLTAPPTPPGPSAWLSNLSVRTTAAANQTVIVGLGVTGGARDLLVRAVGPGLVPFGVTNAMADPQLELFRGPTLVLANHDWPATLAPAFLSAGAFGLTVGSRDAAFRQNLDGSSSIQVRGSGPGVVLIEAYDLGSGNSPRLVNLSARNRVGPGDDLLIAGFNLTGTGTKQVLIRAIGPGLATFGVTGVLADPRLDVFTAAGARVAENDNWNATLAPTFSAVGAFGLTTGSRDAALLATLPVGTYTVQVRGTDNGNGEALVEIYEVP